MNNRRNLIKSTLSAAAVASVLPQEWIKPVINSIILPAHAQSSMPTSPGGQCLTDTMIGGPLEGNQYGADSCQLACEAEADALNAKLCDVRETTTNGIECACDLDLP